MPNMSIPSHDLGERRQRAGDFRDMTPRELLATGLFDPATTESGWVVRWDREVPPGPEGDEIIRRALPETLDLHTSGSTGASVAWRRTRDQLWDEAVLLAGLLEGARPDAALSFAPPRHLYGALVSVLVPAVMRLPVWYRPRFFGPMPPAGPAHWAVMAVPWTFSILRRQAAWVRSAERLTVLHSTALLPSTAGDLLHEVGPDRVRLVEILGSTETGGIATREWAGGDPPWTLFPDVALAPAGAPGGEGGDGRDGGDGGDVGEIPLSVASPRLAHRVGGSRLDTWQTDDWIVPLDGGRFRLVGRRGRLLKANGRRIRLDEAEERARRRLPCADLALVARPSALGGEELEVLVVPPAATRLAESDVVAVVTEVAVRPRNVRFVDRIDRAETGKLRYQQPPMPAGGGERVAQR